MKRPAGLVDLPTEIILEIASYLDIHDLNSLSQTTRALHAILSPLLYSWGATHVGKTTPLIWAVQMGHNTAVERLLEKGADPTVIANSTTAFHEAILCFNTQALALLLQRAPCPAAPNAADRTPLQLAARRRRIVLLRMILKACPGKHLETDGDWIGALLTAVSRGNVAAVRCLLTSALTVSGEFPIQGKHTRTIMTPVENGDYCMLELLREFGWDSWGSISDEDMTPLHVAAEKGHVKVMELLLSYGADINATDDHGATPLHRAVYGGHLAGVELLLATRADVNAAMEGRKTALHISAFSMNLKITAVLISAGAAVNTHIGYTTPLISAIASGCQPLARLLIESGANVSASPPSKRAPLFEAARKGQSEIVHLLLARGAAVTIEAEKKEGFTPLAAAAHGGYIDLIQPLVDAGFDVTSALYYAIKADNLSAKGNNLTIIRQLLRCGADVNRKDPTSGYVLNAALALRRPGALRLLLEAGADITHTNDGSPILHVAAKRAVTAEFVKLLIEHGADINALDAKNMTALHVAAQAGSTNVIQALLDAGISTEARDISGMTALHHAARDGTTEYTMITKQLLRGGADVDAQDDGGRTSLHLAASHSCSEIHSLLIDAGADIVATDQFGQTPLHIAASTSNTTLFRQMLKLCIRDGLGYMTESVFGMTVVEEAARAGCVPILRMLADRGIDVARNSPLPETEDSYSRRRLSPLHLAIINSYPLAMDYLLTRGADPFTLGIYGRSAVDWVLLYRNEEVLQKLHWRLDPRQIIRTPNEPCVASLTGSIARFATTLLSSKTNTSVGTNFYALGKCLQYLDNLADAAIAFSQDPTPLCCDGCQKEISMQGSRHVCRTCPEIDLCVSCFDLYQQQRLKFWTCSGHEFLKIVVADRVIWEGEGDRTADGDEQEGALVEDDDSAAAATRILNPGQRRWLEYLVETYRSE